MSEKITLKEKCIQLSLTIHEVVGITGVSRETLRNWLLNKPRLLDAVIKGVYFQKIINNLANTLDNDK